MTKTPLWSDEYLLSLIASMEDICFWSWSSKGNLIIDKYALLRRFCPSIGVFNLPMDTDDKGCPTFTPVFIRGNRIQEVNGSTIQVVVERFLELWDTQTGETLGDEVVAALAFCPDIFDTKGLATLPKKKGVEVLKDTATAAYVFFQNGWVEVTADATSALKPYEDIPANRFIWENRIIPNDYVTRSSVIQSLDLVASEGKDPATGEYLSKRKRVALHKQLQKQLEEEEAQPAETHFLDFLRNLARDETGEVCEKNLNRIKLAVGYLSHRYHFADMRKWVMVVDRHIDYQSDKANGGNGKSILINSLSNFLNVTEIDGREFRKNSRDRFAFSGVSASDDILYFDDADKNFDLKRLYSKVTGSFEVAVKYKNTFTIPSEDAPKVAITSNYAIADDDPSTQRRNFQVEVSDFYKTQLEEYGLRPADFHGGKLIARKDGGWSAADWGHYYAVICDCIRLYLKKGLPAQAEESITFKRNRLCADFPVSNPEELLDFFLAYLTEAAATGEERFAEVFYKETREKFVFPEETTNRDLWELLKKVGKAFRLLPNNHQKGNLQQQRLCVSERQQRWFDAGMEGYCDQHGNNPLEDKNSKVYVFTVTSFQNTAAVSKKPDFNKSSDEVTSSPVKQTA